MYVCVFIFATPMDGISVKTSLQWQACSVALLFAWINLVLYLRRFASYGIYVLMMRKICVTLIKVSKGFYGPICLVSAGCFFVVAVVVAVVVVVVVSVAVVLVLVVDDDVVVVVDIVVVAAVAVVVVSVVVVVEVAAAVVVPVVVVDEVVVVAAAAAAVVVIRSRIIVELLSPGEYIPESGYSPGI